MWPEDRFQPSRPLEDLASEAIARGRQLRRRRTLARRLPPALAAVVVAAVLPMVLASDTGDGTEVRTTGETSERNGRPRPTTSPVEGGRAGALQAPGATVASDLPGGDRSGPSRPPGSEDAAAEPEAPGSTGTDIPPLRSSDRLVFTGTADAGTDVFTSFADGSGVRRLTTAPANDFWPSWAPDGRRIAFYSDRDGTNQVYVMDDEGGALRRLTHVAGDQATQPAWSPDGRSIAFSRFQRLVAQTAAGGVVQKGIWAVRVDGGGAHQLTSEGGQPAWSPDGRRLAFVTPDELRVLAVDSGRVAVITRAANVPSWSPDGSRIAFGRVVDGREQLFVVNADGSGERRLITSAAHDSLPNWTPDGSHIVFTRDVDGRAGSVDCLYLDTGRCQAGGPQPQALWIVGSDGTGARPLFPATVRGDYNARFAPR